MSGLPAFDRYIGIDYSGAQTPVSSLKGLRIYMSDRYGLLLKCRRRPAHANTGHGEKLPNGWWNAFQKIKRPWLGSTTAFRFPCGISISSTCPTIGQHFLTIFNAIGRQMTNTPTLILCAMAFVAMVQPDVVTHGGGASQKKEPERSLCFTSTCPAPLQSPRMPDCRGCGISAYTCRVCTFGLSMAGM